MGLESKNQSFLTGDSDTAHVTRHGILKSIYVTSPSACYTVDLYDHCTTCMVVCNGCLITTIDGAAVGLNMPYLNKPFAKGLVADVTGTGGIITIIYE